MEERKLMREGLLLTSPFLGARGRLSELRLLRGRR
jgi:hypothetical protein